jgi:hypothetical protein
VKEVLSLSSNSKQLTEFLKQLLSNLNLSSAEFHELERQSREFQLTQDYAPKTQKQSLNVHKKQNLVNQYGDGEDSEEDYQDDD